MTKLIQALMVGIAGMVAVAVASPALTKMIHAVIPLIAVAGVAAAVLRVVWFYTR
jgi:hypothetical protein